MIKNRHRSSEELTLKSRKSHNSKGWIPYLVIPIISAGITAGIVFACPWLFGETVEEEVIVEVEPETPHYYSVLTGLEITDPALNSKPTYCMQIPNGDDGARPQVGLSQAGVVFEAIAEAGITRFAAVFQNPTSSAIGPIRSLRLYYYDWDVPFDCTIVHAGGSDEAIAAARAYGRDLSESNVYEWRMKNGYWAPNNLFTSANLLAKYNTDKGYTTSNPKAFARLTPENAAEISAKNIAAAKPLSEEESSAENHREVKALIDKISIRFGGSATYNTLYQYDQNTNTYLRSYASGADHITYTCPEDASISAPKSECGEPSQIAPSAVAAIMVDQWLDSDRYHLRTQTIGSGVAHIFQNGEVIEGTWNKASREDQIVFKDTAGNEIALTPGQLWIAAVPNSTGSVKY